MHCGSEGVVLLLSKSGNCPVGYKKAVLTVRPGAKLDTTGCYRDTVDKVVINWHNDLKDITDVVPKEAFGINQCLPPN